MYYNVIEGQHAINSTETKTLNVDDVFQPVVSVQFPELQHINLNR